MAKPCAAASVLARICHRKARALHGMCLPLSMVTLGAPPASAQSPALSSPASPSAHPFAPHIADASQRFGVPQNWIWAVMHVESRGNPRAISSAGAIGLMQLMPGTWTMLTARYRLGRDPFDIRANIHGGAAYLRLMWERYRSVPLMLAAYNAGPGRVDAYTSGQRALPFETRRYVARIAPVIGISNTVPAAPPPEQIASEWVQAELFTAQRSVAPDDNLPTGNIGPIAAVSTSTSSGDDTLLSAPHPLFVTLSERDE